MITFAMKRLTHVCWIQHARTMMTATTLTILGLILVVWAMLIVPEKDTVDGDALQLSAIVMQSV